MNEAIKRILDYNHAAGTSIVDPEFDLSGEAWPDDVLPGAQQFRTRFLENPRSNTIKELSGYMGGVSPKTNIRVGGMRDPSTGRVGKSQDFMIKPYYEDLAGWGHTWYPLAGWAEMATQGLLHAAGLGHMAMKIHSFDAGRSQPLLAIHLDKDVRRIGDISSWGTQKNVKIPREIREDAAKLAMMDFLTNHQDRHGGNLMYRVNPDDPETMSGLLAIDNGRSFQYHSANRFSCDKSSVDSPFYYMESPAFSSQFDFNKSSIGTVIGKWWTEKKAAIIEQFKKHLTQGISEPKIADHLEKSFNDRVKAMDNFAAAVKEHGGGVFKENSRVPVAARKKAMASVKVKIRSHTPLDSFGRANSSESSSGMVSEDE